MQWSDDTLIKKFQFYSIPRLALIGRDGLIAHERVRMDTAKSEALIGSPPPRLNGANGVDHGPGLLPKEPAD